MSIRQLTAIRSPIGVCSLRVWSVSNYFFVSSRSYVAMAPKRKVHRATSPVRPSPTKRPRTDNGEADHEFDHSRVAEKYGIVQRDFYPPEMSNERCERYNKNEITRPIDALEACIKSTKTARGPMPSGECVVHWFKRDLRTYDNRALSLASEKAKSASIPLICMYITSPQDFQAHCTSAVRVDFELRTLEVIKTDLEELDIPLYVATIDDRRNVIPHILQRCAEWGAKHLYCNIEYEVDELRREMKLMKKALDQDIAVNAIHDDVVVPPGDLTTGAGKQYSVYSPYYRNWVKHVHEHPHLLSESPRPSTNPNYTRKEFKSLFDNSSIPSAPENKRLEPQDQKRLASLWPAGEHEALERLQRFLNEKITAYKDTRNFPASNSTSMISPHLSTGTLGTRTAIRFARDSNTARALDAGNPGIKGWISELVWRDFYKHVLCHWPYVCMNKSFKYEYTDIEWEYNEEQFDKWCKGQTGFPLVDAAMRQLNTMGWMHNRCRMVVASFLAKDLLIDWRMGEKYFMEHLIDGDFASNNGGWGFSASTGVDPQPYFRIFNPFLQSEKFDEGGEYIRKWVPELAAVEGKAIHDPYNRGKAKEAEKAGYPRPIVDHSQARQKALERYKAGLGRSTANEGGGVHN